MEIIKGLVRKNIPSIIINNLIIFVSFVFADISMVIGLQLNLWRWRIAVTDNNCLYAADFNYSSDFPSDHR